MHGSFRGMQRQHKLGQRKCNQIRFHAFKTEQIKCCFTMNGVYLGIHLHVLFMHVKGFRDAGNPCIRFHRIVVFSVFSKADIQLLKYKSHKHE
jgi:hypothetical protein